MQLTQYWVVEAGFHGKVGKDVRKVKLPEVTKEEAEATLMVVFTTPLKRLGLVDKQRHTHKNRKTNEGVLQTEHCTQNSVKWR